MPSIDGKPVSSEWARVLTAARRAGVRFRVNSGRRTMQQQWQLYRLHLSGRGNLAAYPNPHAPHIREGRTDHAVDVDALDGGAQRLAGWLRARGARPSFPVPGEPWHLEVPAADLRRLATQAAPDPLAALTETERRWARELAALRRAKRNRPRRAALLRALVRARKRAWRAVKRQPTPLARRRHAVLTRLT